MYTVSWDRKMALKARLAEIVRGWLVWPRGILFKTQSHGCGGVIIRFIVWKIGKFALAQVQA